MANYAPHLRFLVYLLTGLLFLFIFSYNFEIERLFLPAWLAVIVVVGTVLILSRFGGDLGGTR